MKLKRTQKGVIQLSYHALGDRGSWKCSTPWQMYAPWQDKKKKNLDNCTAFLYTNLLLSDLQTLFYRAYLQIPQHTQFINPILQDLSSSTSAKWWFNIIYLLYPSFNIWE